MSIADDMWICIQCRATFCATCWDQQIPHKKPEPELDDGFDVPEFESSGYVAHEKVTREVCNRLTRIFADRSEKEQAGYHKMESRAKWFGAYRGDHPGSNQFYLADTDRLTSVINDSWTKEFPDQFPSIVTFVGQTGMSHHNRFPLYY